MSGLVYTAIGVISGTSMDGIDVALVRTDGEDFVQAGPGKTYAYDPALRAKLQDVIADPERAEKEPLTDLEIAVTQAHSDAIIRFMVGHGITAHSVNVIGFHGQTIFHAPKRGVTRQLGLGEPVAKRLGIDVVYRFRDADVAAGGEGAPLVPVYHQALASKHAKPLMVLNLGGVGNVTYLDGKTVIAFDTGPASALLDDFMLKRRGKPFDENGALAAAGMVDVAMLRKLLANPYFDRKPPKSLDRNEFHAMAALVEGLGDEDGAATLSAFTVEAAIAALRHVPTPPKRWLVTGGGRHNGVFMKLLTARLGVPVEPVETVGWDGDFLEAQCFGYLAVRSKGRLPLSLPTTTGVREPTLGGKLAKVA